MVRRCHVSRGRGRGGSRLPVGVRRTTPMRWPNRNSSSLELSLLVCSPAYSCGRCLFWCRRRVEAQDVGFGGHESDATRYRTDRGAFHGTRLETSFQHRLTSPHSFTSPHSLRGSCTPHSLHRSVFSRRVLRNRLLLTRPKPTAIVSASLDAAGPTDPPLAATG